MDGIDKGTMPWQGKPMIEHVIQHIQLPADKIIISANRNHKFYKKYASTVISDKDMGLEDNFQGPLVGILSAMQICPTPYLVCLPCDSPHPPLNMLSTLWQGMKSQHKHNALCHDGQRLQPLFSLLTCSTKAQLKVFLQQGGRKVYEFMNSIDPAICDFSTQKDRFNNFNHPHDMNT